ncbi:MAG: adenylate/guanylate cyclase domain-containing protein [Betaproteobacteria bacterium]|nr:adenylate/guanylate cyclase domain-containing protein [Betaproteobacteria bacterium]
MKHTAETFMQRLRSAGIEPGDSEELRLQKSLLVFASGLVSIASIGWLLIYWALGPKLSTTLPFVLQLTISANLVIYAWSGSFPVFRFSQLAVFLFFPFIAQWALGNFVNASGVILWGLLAPIGALLCSGTRESLPWFVAYLFLTLLTGIFEFLLADSPIARASPVPLRISMAFFALNFATLSTFVWLLLRFAIAERQKAREALEDAHRLLGMEQERSERLLLNVLPQPIAERLKDENQTIADGFPEVTVMFADIVNFTGLAASMTPQQVFSMLNRIFSHFDGLAEKHGLEKIKTIGDAYMVAGGLNTRHAEPCAAIARLALDMRAWLAGEGARGPQPIQLRIGIGTGPVVAGVVGKKKFIYDLWGDTVNLASRITGEGPPGSIQCDAKTYSLLTGSFVFEPPVEVQLKGKGPVIVYRLRGQNPSRRSSTMPKHHVGDGADSAAPMI